MALEGAYKWVVQEEFFDLNSFESSFKLDKNLRVRQLVPLQPVKQILLPVVSSHL